jgi:hypothetical protein
MMGEVMLPPDDSFENETTEEDVADIGCLLFIGLSVVLIIWFSSDVLRLVSERL